MTPETEIKKSIVRYLGYGGWFSFPVIAGMGSVKGSPDRVAIRDGITLYIEVKSEKGRQTPEQVNFQRNIESHDGHYVLVRSVEELDSEIQKLTGEKVLMFA
jgi:hypothetical protein